MRVKAIDEEEDVDGFLNEELCFYFNFFHIENESYMLGGR